MIKAWVRIGGGSLVLVVTGFWLDEVLSLLVIDGISVAWQVRFWRDSVFGLRGRCSRVLEIVRPRSLPELDVGMCLVSIWMKVCCCAPRFIMVNFDSSFFFFHLYSKRVCLSGCLAVWRLAISLEGPWQCDIWVIPSAKVMLTPLGGVRKSFL